MHSSVSEKTPKTLSAQPVIQGGSTIGIKYDKGILLGADTLLKYAGCYWYKDIRRINQISSNVLLFSGKVFHTQSVTGTRITCLKNVLLASGGDYSDLQQILMKLKEKRELDEIADDGNTFLEPKDYCKWLANLHFNKRMRVDPYWNSHLVAGVHSKTGEKYLGIVDLYGNTFEGKYLLTGVANYFCNSLLYDAVTDDLTLEKAKELIDNCFRVLYYRDKFQSDMIQLATITDDGEVTFEEPYRLESKWDYNYTKTKSNDELRDMRCPK